MKVSVAQERLAHALSVVNRAVASRSTLPVLSHILIKAAGGRLQFSATNLELGITCWLPAGVEQEGSTTVPARTFSDLVATLPSQQVTLTLDSRTQTLNIRGGTSTNDLKCIDANEFPPINEPDWTDAIHLNVADFRELIQSVAFAASSDEARPVLMGVLMTADKDKLTLAAADGFRLSVRSATLSSPAKPVTAIVPAKSLLELARVIPDGESIEMVITKNRNQVAFRGKDVELTSQLIEGTFPDYKQIIPREEAQKTRVIVGVSAMLKACKQAEIFAREGSNVARLNVKAAGGEMESSALEISAVSEETGKNETIVEASVDGSGVLIAFNVRFLREALEVIKTPNAVFAVSAAGSPALIRPSDEKLKDFQQVIMPMHLS